MKHSRSYIKQIYTSQVIAEAIKAYGKIASISMSEKDEHYVCVFTNCVVDPERVMLEFDNYLIELLHLHESKEEA